ncbi:TonB-dependent receptor [Maribacter confluentis]|uniref:TonB-dependent receptor n=1 Tax=Maribacter confluentis TaxID=1656093 RepID=A0ABT8RV80_9FLAO|nr:MULTISPECIES: outer membrane beta-barrel family protein [Maribacter]MDO1514394.1 TonB-dependent receptor [Maribacter confluentis]MDO1514836.1 TonB-dependent receptor [Maribacter confluentis]TVZ13903.1 outer membrane receptor protein involved in Fe transport [Maribacter sp. MAR_2009_72]
MKKLFPLLLILALQPIFSQTPQGERGRGNGQGPRDATPIKITGKVLDKENDIPLEYATLVLQSVENPDQISGGITDLDGNFNVEAKPGKYNISIEYISYKTYRLPNQTLTASTDLGTIRLALDVAQLDAVEVVGEKTTVEVRLDKKIYNIGKDLTNSGATITDALNNVPSVDVDVEGAISLRGNENVRILINGKPSALAGFGSTDALTQLPADAIEKVEVITSPSARYDAEGTAGILNIILKKEKTLGFNGSVNTTIGYPVNSGITVNANLRTDKFNIFNTTGYSYRDAPGNAFFDNTYTSGSFDRIIEDREYNRMRKGFNTNLGLEYFITEESSITGSVFYRTSDSEDSTENTNQRFIDSAISSETFRTEDETEDDENYQFSLNYVNNLDDDGQKLTVDLQYSKGEETKFSIIEENNTVPNQNLLVLENVYEIESENEYLVQADYVLPMGDSQFEVGYRGTFEEDVTDYRLDSLNQSTNQFDINENLTNMFTYTENVNALYTQYGNKFGKFSFLLGLRLENTQLKGQLDSEFDTTELEEQLGVDVDVNFDKNYLGLFPTLNFILEIAENENISLGYNRRINRPRGWFVNPFPSRSSRTNIFQGNPDLNPAFSNAFDLGYLKRWDKLTLTSSIYYQRETDSFERVQEETGQTTTDGIEIIRSIPINLSTNDRIGLEAGMMYNPTKWLRLNSSFNFFQFSTEGMFNGIDYGANNTSWFARFSSKVSLPSKIDWQTNAFYRGPSQNAQTESKGIFSLNLAFSKDILDDNGTISMNVSDLLNSRKRRSFTETEFFTSESEFQWRRRQITLGFVYRFNQPKERNRNGRGNGPGEGGEEEIEG